MTTDTLLRTFLTGMGGLAIAASIVNPSSAADYSYRLIGKDKVVVDMSGTIEADEHLYFNDWLSRVRLPEGRHFAAFVLNSAGGNVAGAMSVAAYVRQNNLNTGVAAGGTCASACTVIWAASSGKSVAPDARIGLHAAQTVEEKTRRRRSTVFAGDYNKQGTQFISNVLYSYGMHWTLIGKMQQTPPTAMYWLTADDYAAMNAKITW